MKVFLDTNVILEYFLDREDGKTANRLFALLQEQKHSLYMTVGSFYMAEGAVPCVMTPQEFLDSYSK